MPKSEPQCADPSGSRDTAWRSALFVLLIVGAYCSGLWWLDRSNGTFRRLASASHWLFLAAVPVLTSFLIRFWRWRWLLRRSGQTVPFVHGLLAYLAGFALTATPGKTGELLRIRYFKRLGVPPSATLAAFVFERACDLLVIVLLSLTASRLLPEFALLGSIALAFVLLLFAAARWRTLQVALERVIAHSPVVWLRRTFSFTLSTARSLDSHINARALVTSLGTGVLVWSLTSAVFAGVCVGFGVAIDPLLALGIYPLAMLIGALSFVPGGIGTTELAIVLMLNRLGVGTADAIAVAVGARLVTLWLAVVVGSVAVLLLERLNLRSSAYPC